MSAAFDTPLALSGPLRQPKQMLAEQAYGGHTSIHDDAMAEKLGSRAGPIEGPTHFSPSASSCRCWRSCGAMSGSSAVVFRRTTRTWRWRAKRVHRAFKLNGPSAPRMPDAELGWQPMQGQGQPGWLESGG